MRKIVGVMAVLMAAWAPWAHAQVAVPELAPGATRIFSSQLPIPAMTSFVPENPAALQWGAPSRFGGGMMRGHKSHLLDGDSSSDDGTLVGFRLVSMSLAVAGESMDMAVDFPATASGGEAHHEKSQSALAVSFAWPDWLAFGLASQQSSLRVRPSDAAALHGVDLNGWVAGASVKVGELLYVGGAYGRDEAKPAYVDPSVTARGEQGMVGIALRKGGDFIWRLEADVIHRNDFKDDNDVKVLDGYELYLGSADIMWGNWLLGGTAYQSQDVVLNGAQAAAIGTNPVVNLNGYTIDYGYAPLAGLTVTGRFEHSELTSDRIQISFEEINSLVITWQF